MADPRDFLALCRLGVPGLALLTLGLLGVFVQKTPLRRALSFAVLVVGALLLTDAAGRFHRLAPVPSRSLTFLTIAVTPLLFVIVRLVMRDIPSKSQQTEQSEDTSR